MLNAEKRKQENIAEYIIYMYQIEDLIRACNFDVELIMESVVRPQLPDDSFAGQYRKWYEQLVRDMKNQRIEKVGHLMDLREILLEISYLHNTLLNVTQDEKYRGVYERATPYIEEFKEKSNLKDKNQIEIAFHALYMKLLLRLQKKEISSETEEAFDAMRMMLAYLSRAYHKMKSGDLDFLKN
jgi:hypothetical protein